MFTLTGSILRQICPKLHPERAEKIAGHINVICPQYGINTADILHEFLANLVHECDEFTDYEEGLNYSVQGLIDGFKRHRISIEDANRYGRSAKHPADQKAIGNIIYGGEWGKKNLGNILPGDGFMFRGSGSIQITGRANVQAFANWMLKKFGIKKTAEEWANLLRTSDEYSLHAACWFFAIAKKLIDEAINDFMKTIVERINGGLKGLPKRMQYYELCKKLIV